MTTATNVLRKRKWPLWLIWVLALCLLAGLSWFIYDGLTFKPMGEIAYECKPRGGAVDICIINADGSNYRPVVQLEREDALSPAWSPNGKELAFVGGGRIYTMSFDNNTVSEIKIDEPSIIVHGPIVWSSKGDELLIQATVNNITGLFLLRMLPLPIELTQFAEGVYGYTPYRSVFSTDNNWIFHPFASGPSSATTLRTNRNTLESIDLGFVCNGASVSPNGKLLACNGAGGVDVLSLSDGSKQSIENWSTNLSKARAPAWSPDGLYIVYFQTHWPAFMGNHNGELWIMRADGSHPTKLTNGPGDRNPAWRPQP